MPRIKEDFPIFIAKEKEGVPYVYLDSAATTHKPQQVIDVITDFYTNSYATVNRVVYGASQDVTHSYHGVRDKIARWIGATYGDEIIFTRGTTAALNLLAISANDSLIPPGGVVLVSEAEHHANVVSWELACRRKGSCVKKIKVHDSGIIDLNHLEDLLHEGAHFVSIPHINNVTGAIQPVQDIASLVHRYGAYISVDGAQGVAHQLVQVVLWDVDFYAFSGHKIYGPTGVGVLYGKRELLKELPPVEGGGDMLSVYDSVTPKYLSAPMKFEAGTPPIAAILGLGAAIDYLESLSSPIYQNEEALTQYLHKRLLDIPGLEIIGPSLGKPRGALISLKVEGAHVLDLGCLLDLEGIAVRTGHQCAQPAMARWNLGHVLRASLGIYNDKEDIDIFVTVLQKAIDQIR
ncbi:cysteine desulfurase, SufS family protein [Chlamydia ibidis]|uniref:Cysteine desulfurase n=2 Tax=Chlamydia ibidis TaxID=1405396 RepID=S7KE84_9CHLA|nr:SufS family cysteine desulfurase [Chlamydia ibidis]EPP34521.1 cysteine desulfurase, SufS family protein [Chlamydia ibidis]EQM63095.1 cysteine desulfurase, SufS subfamily protein [Chlamydia ibidis 10-1398/6]